MKDERETIYQISSETRLMVAWTDDPKEMAHWRKLGWPVRVFGRFTTGRKQGQPRSWEARDIPSDRVILRRVAKKKLEPAGVSP